MNGTFLPDTETTEFESRVYLNPETSLGEQNSFIDNYRDTVKQNTNQITTQTRNLGTDVSSNLGGLTGGTGYWTSRYQTPQTNTAIADLRATAQAQALNTVLSNEKAKWQKRYDDAYKAYQKRQNDKTNTSTDAVKGDGDFESTDKTVEMSTPGIPGGYTVADIDTDNNTVIGYNYVPYGQEGQTQYSSRLSYSKVPITIVNVREGKVGSTLPSGKKIMYEQNKQSLLKGSDGDYYLHDIGTGNYTNVGS